MNQQLPTSDHETRLCDPDRPSRDTGRSARLAEPDLRELLIGFARSRVPEADVEDVVQTVLCAGLAAQRVPEEREELRRWLIGVARHKVADLHRRRARVRGSAAPAQAAEALEEASEWLLWAEKQLQGDREHKRTMGWMARESEGEKLAQIAAAEALPAPQLRQRISRLRRQLKRRWAAELALITVLLIGGLLAWQLLPTAQPQSLPLLEGPFGPPLPAPRDRAPLEALELRVEALAACDEGHWQRCLDLLDSSLQLAPESAELPLVQLTRARAQQALEWQRVEKELERKPIRDYKTGP